MSNMIQMVISGNLTGFSHFYASPQAKSLLSEAPFDFDYRNYLTFLNGGEKAYALSFAPRVLAMSVVTRILDSFRRPGVLVVTLLVPRGEQVVQASGQSSDAAYRLLNELFERFMERCFMNGMLNQNSAVLMQDYYADIVGRYALAPDGRQRAVNTAINVSTNIKRSGYVATPENLVPLYLATPWRRSYEGFHHVFLAQHPKENLIDEQPEEVVLYRVTVSNTGQTIPAVRLTDQIPQVMPGEGEKDIASKNFTYQQVLNGEAQGIVAKLQDETIELNYRFVQEEKEIVFRFMHGGKKVKFESVMPRLRLAGEREVQLPNEKCLFLGAEINATVTVLISDPHYQVEGGTVDLRRLKNGDVCTLQLVERRMSEQRPFPTPQPPKPQPGPNPKPDVRPSVIIAPDPTPKSRPNGFNMKVAGILGCVCVAAYLLVASFTHGWPFADGLSDAGGDDELVADSAITKTVVVTFVDASNVLLSSNNVDHKLFDNGSMKCFVASENAQDYDGFDKDKLAFTFKLTGKKDQEFAFSVAVDGVNVCSEEKHKLSDIGRGLVLKLDVKASDVKTYFGIKAKIDEYRNKVWALENEYSKQKSRAETMSDSELKTRILDMLEDANKSGGHNGAAPSEPTQNGDERSGKNTPTTQKANPKQNQANNSDALPKVIADSVANKGTIRIPTGLNDDDKKRILIAYLNVLKDKDKKAKFNGSGVKTYSALHKAVAKVKKTTTQQ